MIAVYAGSFDPFTFGHASVVREALALFDEVICLVAVHPTKTPLFSVEDRLRFIRETVPSPRVRTAFTRGYAVQFAREAAAQVLVRGVRDATDSAYEIELAHANRQLAPEISTVFVPADTQLAKVSSSELKLMAAAGSSISHLCHPSVELALRQAAQSTAVNE
ncbi:MAG TPA: pantetheine-phosphate adenylyltransferase [Polyangiaceae bacterium]|jgi:pantetheine-phosphate adenylyltransferase|nr:pantetheine-phosphate adenylyltransferase [Polyangiaceae bacterium]